MRHAPLIQVRDWQVVGSPFSQEIMRSLFSGFRNIFARASTHAWPPQSADHRTANAILWNWTERTSHPRRSITHWLHEQTTEWDIHVRGSDTYHIYPTRIDFPLSSLQIWNTYVATTMMTTTLQGCKCALRELSPAGTAIAVLKTDRCFATRLLATIRDCWKI